MEQSYLTIQKQAQAEFTESRSRFIGTIAPVKTEAEALAFIAALKKQYWDAKHNVYAYVLREERISRSTDDGEPQGTAGAPVLEVLQKQGLTDCVVVLRRRLCAEGRVICDYADYGRVQPLVMEFGGVVDDTVFEDAVTLKFHLPLEQEPPFQKQLTEISAGRLQVCKENENFYDFSEQ